MALMARNFFPTEHVGPSAPCSRIGLVNGSRFEAMLALGVFATAALTMAAAGLLMAFAVGAVAIFGFIGDERFTSITDGFDAGAVVLGFVAGVAAAPGAFSCPSDFTAAALAAGATV